MPFFLVTHTSLVEADNEASAAKKAAEDIRSGRQLTMTVKVDEQNVRQVTVIADEGPRNGRPNDAGCKDSDEEELSPDHQDENRFDQHSSEKGRCGRPQLAGKMVGVGVIAALSMLLFVLAAHGDWSS